MDSPHCITAKEAAATGTLCMNSNQMSAIADKDFTLTNFKPINIE